jgi:hypothetical protein
VPNLLSAFTVMRAATGLRSVKVVIAVGGVLASNDQALEFELTLDMVSRHAEPGRRSMRPGRWTATTESSFPWEREALEFLREHLPDHDPWRAWSNFEFVDDQGRVNEVDLLVLGPRGLILVEIFSGVTAPSGQPIKTGSSWTCWPWNSWRVPAAIRPSCTPS